MYRQKTLINMIDESIDHWLSNAAYAEKGMAISTGPHECALCRRFLYEKCKGCPVAAWTGESHCRSSPYRDVITALEQAKRTTNPMNYLPVVVNAIYDEIDFLCNVRGWISNYYEDYVNILEGEKQCPRVDLELLRGLCGYPGGAT